MDRFTPDHMIMGGDLNLGLEVSIDKSGCTTNNEGVANVVRKYMDSHQVFDVWRQLYPNKNGYTWRKLKPTPKFCRLDYFLTSEAMSQFIDSIKIIPGFKIDHSIVELLISVCKIMRGPGYWKLNTSLLKDWDYVEKINNLIDVQLEINDKLAFSAQWESLKLAARGSSIQYSAGKQKSKRKLMELLECKLKRLEQETDLDGLFKK